MKLSISPYLELGIINFKHFAKSIYICIFLIISPIKQSFYMFIGQ